VRLPPRAGCAARVAAKVPQCHRHAAVRSQQQIAQRFVARQPFGDITRDDILDNGTFYW